MTSKALCVLMLIAIGLAIRPSHATESHAELYWKAKLGNTRMPTVLKDSLLLGSSYGTVKLNQNYKHSTVDNSLWSCSFTYDCIRFRFSRYAARDETPLPKDDQVTKPGQLAGAKMKLNLGRTTDTQSSKFLPLRVSAKLTPFSSSKLQDILRLVSAKPKSVVAQKIEATIKDCEEKGVKDEVRYCATSLEGMVDYVTLNSRQNKVKVYYTDLEEESSLMEYKIQKSQKIQNDKDNSIVCHKTDNPFAVFLCHNIKKTDAYVVSLLGENGKQLKGIAVCHKDTSSWNPEHLAFRLLKIKPGSKPVCHFLSPNAVVWVPY